MIENKEIEESKKKEELEKKNIITGVIRPSKKRSENELSGVIKGHPTFENDADYLLYNINSYALLVNKLDTYGNSIPLGAFCYALSFICTDFSNVKYIKKKINF